MTGRYGLKTLLAVAMALMVVAGASRSVAAEHGKPNPGRGGPMISVAGVISAIDVNDDGSLITLQRDAGDVEVQVTDDTRIVPPGATPAVGDSAHVVARKPKQAGDVLVATVLNLAGGPHQPGTPPTKPQRHVCGTIAALPADPHDGVWTLSVPIVGDYEVTVTADTKITPADATPELGGAACVKARQTDAGWLAETIHLNARTKPGHDKPGPKGLVIHATVVGPLPADRSGDWTLELAIEGAANQSVLVTPDTQIAGELADGVKVVVHAHWETIGGVQTLVADKIAVCDDEPAGPKGPATVRVEGVVTDAGDTTWTIEADEGDPIVVGITADTVIVGLAEDESPVGREVKGRAIKAADGSLVAKMLRVEKD